MNSLLLFSLLALFVVTYADQYTDRYDNINIDEILSNKRLLTSYIKCILDKGRCTPEGKELKRKYIILLFVCFISLLIRFLAYFNVELITFKRSISPKMSSIVPKLH